MVDSIGSKAGVRPDLDETSPTRWLEARGLEPDPWQQALLTETWDRALLNITRQGGKSTAVGALALETALGRSDGLVLILAPARRQSKEVLIKIRKMYRDTVPDVGIDKLSELRIRFGNGARIIALPGQEATVRGYSAVDLIVADEAARVPDNLYRAVKPMLAVSDGRLVAMSTPAGKRGWFYESWTDPGQKWRRVEVTGWECPRLSAEFLEQERRELGQYIFAQEYECQFADRVNALFGRDEIDAAIDPDIPPLFDGEGLDVIDSDIETLSI